jgi:hypothetical protein
MIEYAADIKVLPFKRIRKKRVVPSMNIPASPVVRKSNNESKTKNSDELKIPFDKWIMPPQPVGYLKYHGFDFF